MKFYCISVLLLLPAAIFAQSNYQPGYVLKNNGDTLKGFINIREWIFSPRSVDFKLNKEDITPTKFNPKTIAGFQVTGLETYVSYTGPISLNRTDLTDLAQRPDTNKKIDTLFLKELATGKNMSLFYQRYNIKIRYFAAGKNEQPTELLDVIYYDNDNKIANSTIYKGQLILYINKYQPGNEKINQKLSDLSYTEDDLESIVDNINDKKTITNKKSLYRFYAGAGINDITSKFYNLNAFGLTQTSSSIAPEINAGIDIFENPNVQQFIIRADLSFTYASPRFNTSGIPNVVVNTPTNSEVYTFNQYTIALNPQVLFNVYNKTNFKIFIDGGIAFNLATYSNNKFTSQGTGANTNILPNFEPFYTSFPLRAGLVLNKKVEIAVCYIGYASYSKFISSNTSNQTIGLGLKYFFN